MIEQFQPAAFQRTIRLVSLMIARPDWTPDDAVHVSGMIELRAATDRAVERRFGGLNGTTAALDALVKALAPPDNPATIGT